MGFKMGIVGLPNVGKSTLFNALTRTAAAQAANFPFCTIEPNVGEVAVPDARLDTLAEIAGSKSIIPTRMTFVDIAGLVKGASKGEGLGNQFLANIRETDAIAHVLRCFEDGDVTHVDGRVDPVADAEVIETELMLSDMESIEKRLVNIVRKVRGGDKEAVQQERLMKMAMDALENGKPARLVEVDDEDLRTWKLLQLLTTKPVLYVCNVGEAEAAEHAGDDPLPSGAAGEDAEHDRGEEAGGGEAKGEGDDLGRRSLDVGLLPLDRVLDDEVANILAGQRLAGPRQLREERVRVARARGVGGADDRHLIATRDRQTKRRPSDQPRRLRSGTTREPQGQRAPHRCTCTPKPRSPSLTPT